MNNQAAGNQPDLRIAMDQNRNLILQTAFTRDGLDVAPTYDKAAYRQTRAPGDRQVERRSDAVPTTRPAGGFPDGSRAPVIIIRRS